MVNLEWTLKMIDILPLTQIKPKNIITNMCLLTFFDLGNNKELISYYNPTSNKMENNKPSSKNSSIPLAVDITSYARIHMSYLKNIAQLQDLTILYMDTDSLSLNGKLDPKYIGTELGKLKLEHIFNEVIYLAPKVYAGKTDTYEYVKVKGLKNHISFDQMKPLLNKDESLQINQDKWYKHIDEGLIAVKNEIYTLMLTDNKRELLFTADGIFKDINPYVLSNGLLINKHTEQ
uniref:hypothetical protein n=1 Tax=Porodaedalea niemelaei TaxID=175858 RepID=UPI0023AB40A5|nr:hypothetical protein P1R16_mgp05 [Porodaedalea niemelaei]WCF76636.1 hypothetical protein [Porodaedalea niemelaei]